MKKAKIYIPTKTAMQSGRGKLKKWVLEFVTKAGILQLLLFVPVGVSFFSKTH